MSRDRKPEKVGTEECLDSIMNWEVLFGLCKCEHYAEVSVRQLRQKYGGDMKFGQLQPKLKCKKCGETGTSGFFVFKMPR